MRTTLAACIACACTTPTLAGELIVEPDQFQFSGSTLLMYGGSIQYQSSGVGLPVQTRQIVESSGAHGGPLAGPAYQQNYRLGYLLDDNPFGATNRISYNSNLFVRSGNASADVDRMGLSLEQLSASFHLTQSSIGTLSGFLTSTLSDPESGGIRTAQASLQIWRLDSGLPQFVYGFSESDEDISMTLDWSESFEPGHYLMTLSLETVAGASTPGEGASSRIVTDFDLSFASIPTPGTVGVFGLAGLCAGRRRR